MLKFVGPYQLLKLLNRGGMGDVYLGLDTRKPEEGAPDARVAVKVVWSGIEAEAPGALAGERNGAELQRLMSQIDDRVPAVLEVFETGDYLVIVLELVVGCDLAEAARLHGPLEVADCVQIALEVVGILSFGHQVAFRRKNLTSRSVVHGDIKPQNILIDNTGRVRLIDFGIAKSLSETRRVVQNDFASLAYASPERLRYGMVDTQADLWALSALLHELLSGNRPYDTTNTQRALRSMEMGQLAPLPVRIPAELRAFLARALSFDPHARFADAEGYERALLEVARHLRLEVQTSGASRPLLRNDGETRRTVPLSAPDPMGDRAPTRPPPSRGDPEATRATGPAVSPSQVELAPFATPSPQVVAGDSDPDSTRRTISPAPASSSREPMLALPGVVPPPHAPSATPLKAASSPATPVSKSHKSSETKAQRLVREAGEVLARTNAVQGPVPVPAPVPIPLPVSTKPETKAQRLVREAGEVLARTNAVQGPVPVPAPVPTKPETKAQRIMREADEALTRSRATGNHFMGRDLLKKG